jgi:predicted transcriptional regulator
MPRLLLYCTKAKPILFKHFKWLDGKDFACKDVSKNGYYCYNGKIVAECDYECEHLYNSYDVIDDNALHYFDTDTLKEKELIERSCISNLELEKYFGKSNGYAIHIKNLHIFDEPKELNEVYTRITDIDRLNNFEKIYPIFPSIKIDNFVSECVSCKKLKKAPQNMQYVYDVNIEKPSEKKVLISIRPEWLCKILNKEKTIEVRRKVLKEMLK